MNYCYFQSPFGKILLTGNELLESIHFPLNKIKKEPGLDFIYNEKPFLQVLKQLQAYFKGELTKFNLEFKIQGTSFQKKVWQELVKIEYGETISYGEVAKKIGNPKAARAVGMANNKNPIPIIIPCHRVIGKNGSLTGFGGGLEIKQYLLELEKHECTH
ncbi:MAG: methylated-DNA--[protein]-cysteine S-methyltransferase [Desulfobacula sp.]|nr:methylated-DNA--[protein]-cysteine S-methyltransferase [Desulfobacula sp.]